MKVGCETSDGLLHVHESTEVCSVCADDRDAMASMFSDLYKDIFGVRPRHLMARAQAEGWTIQDFRDEIEALKPQCSGSDSGMPCALREGHAGICKSYRLVARVAKELL